MSSQIKTSNKPESTLKRILKGSAKILGLILIVILGTAILLGLLPVSIKELVSSPDPAGDYEEALRRFKRILEREKGILMSETAGSQLRTHGKKTDRVYVLVHGYTNSPRQFMEIGELLYERGHNVLIVRLPHHGLKSHDVGELQHMQPEDLSAYSDEVLDIAAGLGEQVHVVGFSVGGAVASWIAQNRPDIERVMILSPMFGLDHLPYFVDDFLMNLGSRGPNINFIGPEEPHREHVYRGMSSRGVAEAMIFGKSVFKQAYRTSPAVSSIIVGTNGNDTTVDNRRTYELAKIWEASGANIVLYEYPESLGLPHNMIDVSEPDTDIAIVNAKILELLGE